MISIESEFVRLLMRIGYLAAWNGLYKEALIVFDAVQSARPDSEIPIIGAAAVAILAGKPDEAIKSLEEGALKLNPGSELGRAHLGCALRLKGREGEGQAMLRDVAENGSDPQARSMAANLLAVPAEQLLNKRNIL